MAMLGRPSRPRQSRGLRAADISLLSQCHQARNRTPLCWRPPHCPRFAFPESAIACRACAIPDFAVAVDRPVCACNVCGVAPSTSLGLRYTPARGWMKTARPGPAAWHRWRRVHLDPFRTCRTRRRRVHRAGTERAGKHSKHPSAPRSGFDGREAGNNRSLLSVTPQSLRKKRRYCHLLILFLIYGPVCIGSVVKIQQKICRCVFAKRVARAGTACYISNRM